MNKKLLLLIPIAGVVGLTLMSNSNENFEKYHVDGFTFTDLTAANQTGVTGAPGEASCTMCHSGSVLAPTAINGMTTTANSYELGQTYSFGIGSVTSANNGFQMTVLDNAGNKAGSFVAGVANTSIQSANSKEYINQTSKAQAWAIGWTAPATDMGPLTVHYSLNVSNDNGGNSGDMVYVGTHALTAPTSGLTNYEKQDEKVNMFFNSNQNELNVKYSLKEKSNIMVQVVDLSGKIIEEVKLGQKSFGPHSSKIQFANIQTEGLYIVSLFINNGIYSRKINLK